MTLVLDISETINNARVRLYESLCINCTKTDVWWADTCGFNASAGSVHWRHLANMIEWWVGQCRNGLTDQDTVWWSHSFGWKDKYAKCVILAALSWNSTTPTPTRTSSRGSSPTRPTRAISWSYSYGKLNDTPTFSRRSSPGCRQGCRCRRHGMRALLFCTSLQKPYTYCRTTFRRRGLFPNYFGIFCFHFCRINDIYVKYGTLFTNLCLSYISLLT